MENSKVLISSHKTFYILADSELIRKKSGSYRYLYKLFKTQTIYTIELFFDIKTIIKLEILLYSDFKTHIIKIFHYITNSINIKEIS